MVAYIFCCQKQNRKLVHITNSIVFIINNNRMMCHKIHCLSLHSILFFFFFCCWYSFHLTFFLLQSTVSSIVYYFHSIQLQIKSKHSHKLCESHNRIYIWYTNHMPMLSQNFILTPFLFFIQTFQLHARMFTFYDSHITITMCIQRKITWKNCNALNRKTFIWMSDWKQ